MGSLLFKNDVKIHWFTGTQGTRPNAAPDLPTKNFEFFCLKVASNAEQAKSKQKTRMVQLTMISKGAQQWI